MLGLLAIPAVASAHGPVDPTASKYLARITHVPAGLQARTVDGDLRLWLRVDRRLTAYVLDDRGAPYLRFSPAGVSVNNNSAMYDINLLPPVVPPTSLGPGTTPHWQRVSSGHTYLWQDGRLQALAKTALAPGRSYIGRWSVPVRIDGRSAAITGGLYYHPAPSVVWFWPIVVVLACTLAGLRLRLAVWDIRIARALGAVALAGFTIASLGHQLHGRPSVNPEQLGLLIVELSFVVGSAVRLTRRAPTWPILFLVAAAALWQGLVLVTTLIDGYVLLALPPLLGRAGAVACLAGGAGLLLVAASLAEGASQRGRLLPSDSDDETRLAADDGCSELQNPSAWKPSA